MLIPARSLTLAMIGSLLALMLLSPSTQARQTQERMVINTEWPHAPARITSLRLRDRSVEFDRHFTADEHWLRDLSFGVTNTSDRPIVFISIFFDFPRPQTDIPPSAYSWHWGRNSGAEAATSSAEGKNLRPGETIEVALTEAQYELLRRFLDETNYSENITSIRVGVREVMFAGDTDLLWNVGGMVRRDPANPQRWIRADPR